MGGATNMALEFRPPTDLVNAYLQRPSPGQEAQAGIQQAFQTYAKTKIDERKSKNDALDTLLKASDAVDLSDPATAKAFAPLYKSAGVDPSIFQPPTPSTGTVQFPQASAAPPVTAGTADAAGTPVTQAPPVSPIVQASRAHPDHQTLHMTPEQIAKMSRTAFGRKVIASQEAGGKYIDAQQAREDKAEDNAPVSFDYARAKAKASDATNAADPFIAIAQKEGRTQLTRKEMTDLKEAITARASSMRGSAFDSMAATREATLRQSLNKDARDSLNPYFGKGAGKDQMQRLYSIGRISPLIDQMLSQKGGGDPRQMREMATSFNKVLTGSGMGAEGQIDALMPNTARSQFAHWQEWWTNNPSGTEQQSFIHRIADSVKREKGAIQNQIRIQAESSAPTLRLLKQHYPEDYQAQVDSVMNNPELVGQETPQPAKAFANEADAEAANLPSGTEITISGRPARVR